MQSPPDYMLGILSSIESTVLSLKEEFPKLTDKEVELSYSQLRAYYQKIARKKTGTEEPLATSDRRQALMDEIMNILDLRKEEGFDDFLIMNEVYYHGDRLYANHEHIYSIAIKRLHQSVRVWKSKSGYLNLLKEQFGDQ